MLSGFTAKGKKAKRFCRFVTLFLKIIDNRLLRSGITHESHNFVDSHLQMPSKAKEWIIIQGFQGWRFAIIIEKSHNVDTLTVEIWNLCKFDPQSEEKSKLDQVEIPCLIEDKYRWIDQWFGSSEIGHKLMNIKDQLSHLQILNFYTDGSLKKHEYNSVQDSRVVQDGMLRLVLHKVKGHSGDYCNDKVDSLAKEALGAPFMEDV
uniref:RNase H type-1 domain-containing protein n=1 Tax=Rhizophagus irregularis (strain DAOM 181602 / DAOM 197198 / MUCL 43194) TaxID=747089 RepID=U9U2Z0_RHIID